MLKAPAIVLVIALDPGNILGFGEGGREYVRSVAWEEVVKADVREGCGALVFLRALDRDLRITPIIETPMELREWLDVVMAMVPLGPP